jgi:hypothetical protein
MDPLQRSKATKGDIKLHKTRIKSSFQLWDPDHSLLKLSVIPNKVHQPVLSAGKQEQELRKFVFNERAPGTHWIGGWVDPRAGLDDVEKRKLLTLPGLELRPLGRPARSQSLYRLRYPGYLHGGKDLVSLSVMPPCSLVAG